jgi:hypothetical protein
MKYFKLSFFLYSIFTCLGSAASFANTIEPQAPILLTQIVGGLASRDGNKVECLIREDHAIFAAHANAVDRVKEMIGLAKREEVQLAMHFIAQVPSVEIYAYDTSVEPAERVLLFLDYSNLQERQGDDAAGLVHFVRTLCE